MDRNLEIVVPKECVASVAAAFDRVPRTRIVTEPTPKTTVLRMCFATRQAVDRSESDLVSWAAVIRKHVHRDTPFVFLLGTAHSVDQWKIAQRIALLSVSWRSTPHVAPDADVARRLALARLHGAEDKLIASAAIQGDTLEVWSCEPRIYRARIAALPSLSKMPRRVRERFEVSSSGSRLHWAEGDLDLNLDSIRAEVDPSSCGAPAERVQAGGSPLWTRHPTTTRAAFAPAERHRGRDRANHATHRTGRSHSAWRDPCEAGSIARVGRV